MLLKLTGDSIRFMAISHSNCRMCPGANAGVAGHGGTFYSCVVAFILTALLAMININSLINKIHRGDLDALKSREVKTINVLSLVALLSGLAFGVIYVLGSPLLSQAPMSSSVAIITDKQTTIPPTMSTKITVKRNSAGKVTEINVGP